MTSRRPTISDVARRAGVSKGAVSFALNDRPGRGAGDPGPDPRGGPRAGLDAEPPGPGPGGVPGAGRRPGHRPPAGDPRLGPVLPGVHRRHRVGARAARPVAAPAGRAGPRPRAGRLPAARRRRPGRRRLPHRPAGRRPAPRAARRGRAARRSGSVRTASAAACPASPSTTGRASRLPSPTSSSSATGTSPTSAGPDEFVHGVSRREAWAGALRAAGLPEGPCVRVRLLGPGRRRRHQGAARPAGAADRDRLRQRPDGHRRDVGGRSPAASTCPRDLSITGFDDTEVTAHLQPPLTTVRTDAYALGQRRSPAVDGRGRGKVRRHHRLASAAASRRPSLHRTTRAPIPSQHHPETENR